MKRVLIASPVKQKDLILKEFLHCLARLNHEGLAIEYAFIDDNDEESELLRNFAAENLSANIVRGHAKGVYHCNEHTHHWQEDLMWKVAGYKDYFIQMACQKHVDYLLLIDSDLALHPQTLVHLVGLDKDVVSEVYWTRWEQNMLSLPQVWVSGQYHLYEAARGETLSEEEIGCRQGEFITKLKCPGVYKVGGLGACTLIAAKALKMGVAFKEIYNLELIGEDRHFCVRAAALRLDLYADTCYPPYHIYRESELAGLNNHKERYDYAGNGPSPRLTLAMLVRNEAGRYLKDVLTHAVQYIDDAVILDDASEDSTVDVCREILGHIPLQIVSNRQTGFHNEVELRKQLWKLATDMNPQWVMILDADEMFEEQAPSMIRHLITSPDIDVYTFRLYDMWNEHSYREDSYWQAHRYYRPFLIRYKPDFPYIWNEMPQHCGRFPRNIMEGNVMKSMLRVKHLGWIKPADKLGKYNRYKKLDPEARYGIKEQYESILDPRPHLIPWDDILL